MCVCVRQYFVDIGNENMNKISHFLSQQCCEGAKVFVNMNSPLDTHYEVVSLEHFSPLLYEIWYNVMIIYENKITGVWPLQWRYNEHNGVSNHRPYDCLLNRLFRCRSKKTQKLCVIGLCDGNSPVTGELHAQRASNAENVSIWWRHHECLEEPNHYTIQYWLLIVRFYGIHLSAQPTILYNEIENYAFKTATTHPRGQ